MSHIKTLKITPTCFDYQLIIHHQGAYLILVKITSCMVNLVMRQLTFICFKCCLVWRGISTNSNDNIGNRNRDLPVCSVAP
jgi:hypothetical protein